MSETISAFINFLEFEKRLSKHTVTAYRTDLRQFEEFLKQKETVPENADRHVVRGWLIALSERKLNAVSINRKIAALRAYYRFLRKKKLAELDPASLLTALKKPRKLPGFVDETAMELLFDSSLFEDSPSGRRDRLIIEILYGTGMRLSELIGLKPGDISLSNATIRVLGKRSKERIIPVTPGLIRLIGEHITRSEAKPGPLLTTDKGERLYPVFVQRLMKRYLSAVTSIEHKSPHLLRHTYATHLLNRGADLNAIRELLGHTSLAATQVYTHNAIEELKKTFLQAHPKA